MSNEQRGLNVLDRELEMIMPLFDWRPWYSTLGRFRPAIDLFEEDATFVAKCYIPGVDKSNVTVEVAEDLLKISGKTERERKISDQDTYLEEMQHGSFARAIWLPKPVEAGKASAKYEKGIVIVRLPIATTATPKSTTVKVE